MRLAELTGDVVLGIGVLAGGPGVVGPVVGVREMKVAMTLTAKLAGAGHGNVLGRLRVKERQAGGRGLVVGGNEMAGGASHMGPGAAVRHGRVGAEQPVGGGEEVGQGLRLGHAPVSRHRRRGMARDTLLALDDAGRSLPRMRLGQLRRQIALSVGMSAAGPLGAFGAMAGVTLRGREDLCARRQGRGCQNSCEDGGNKPHNHKFDCWLTDTVEPQSPKP